MEQLSDLVLGYGQPFDFGAVQLVRVSLPAFPCAPASTASAAAGFNGAAFGVAGYAGAPFQQSWNGPWGWWQGPHAVQAWPLTGALPGTSGAYGAFTGLSGISGQWVRPDASIEISSSDIPLGQSIDSAIPEPSDPAVASWSGSDGMNLVARLTDTSSLAEIQDWIVVFAIGLGIGGSMLASLLFEWLRPHLDRTPQASTQLAYQARRVPAGHPRLAAGTPRRPPNRAALTATILLIAWARLRRGRHQTEPLLIDDIDGGEAADTVRFGLDGTQYEIDLSAAHSDELRTALEQYLAHARRGGGAPKSAARSRGGRPAVDTAKGPRVGQGQGIEVKGRGRVPADVLKQYKTATQE